MNYNIDTIKENDQSPVNKCLFCNTKVKGRLDKKFCDSYCRNTYNNNLKKDRNNIVRNINNALGKNRRILEGFFKANEITIQISTDELIQEGFRFKYHTEIREIEGKIHFCCYEFQYISGGPDFYLITKNNSYAKQ